MTKLIRGISSIHGAGGSGGGGDGGGGDQGGGSDGSGPSGASGGAWRRCGWNPDGSRQHGCRRWWRVRRSASRSHVDVSVCVFCVCGRGRAASLACVRQCAFALQYQAPMPTRSTRKEATVVVLAIDADEDAIQTKCGAQLFLW